MTDKLTTDDLGQMINEGFSNMQANMDERFNQVENRLEHIELRLSNVAYRFELKELEARIKFLEEKVIGQK